MKNKLIDWIMRRLTIVQEVPTSIEGLEFQYVDGGCLPDEVIVFRNGKRLFRYMWVDGECAEKYSTTWSWHKLYKESIARTVAG